MNFVALQGLTIDSAMLIDVRDVAQTTNGGAES